MQNFIFISPNFPTNYWQFCRELKNNGMNVLGIGDAPYGELMDELKESLTEYFKVDSLENYEEVYRAVGYFIFKYGRIDWLESNMYAFSACAAAMPEIMQPERRQHKAGGRQPRNKS